jgi:hypothetical protein
MRFIFLEGRLPKKIFYVVLGIVAEYTMRVCQIELKEQKTGVLFGTESWDLLSKVKEAVEVHGTDLQTQVTRYTLIE